MSISDYERDLDEGFAYFSRADLIITPCQSGQDFQSSHHLVNIVTVQLSQGMLNLQGSVQPLAQLSRHS